VGTIDCVPGAVKNRVADYLVAVRIFEDLLDANATSCSPVRGGFSESTDAPKVAGAICKPLKDRSGLTSLPKRRG